jgi:hypothetical protein
VHFGFGGSCLFVGHFAQSLLFWAHRRVDAQTVLNDGATDSDQVEGEPSEDVLVSGETRDEFLLVSRGQVFAYHDHLFGVARSSGTVFVPSLLCSYAFTFSSAAGRVTLETSRCVVSSVRSVGLERSLSQCCAQFAGYHKLLSRLADPEFSCRGTIRE